MLGCRIRTLEDSRSWELEAGMARGLIGVPLRYRESCDFPRDSERLGFPRIECGNVCGLLDIKEIFRGLQSYVERKTDVETCLVPFTAKWALDRGSRGDRQGTCDSPWI